MKAFPANRAQAKSVYLIGVGGIGMSALARYYKAIGMAVSGSDMAKSRITNDLRKDAIKVKIGHRKANIASGGAGGGGAGGGRQPPDLIIYNRAIHAENPELVAAKKLGIRAIPYAEALGELTEQFTTIAITGSHGKTTTTALAALALARGGLDPTVLIGTNLKEFGGKNIRIGRVGRGATAKGRGATSSRFLVLEADDFGGAFWAYSPAVSIVTNIDKEHMDFYKNFDGVKNAFLKFIARTVPGGALILNRDDGVLRSLRAKIAVAAKKKKMRVAWYSIKNGGREKISAYSPVQKLKTSLQIPGDHNLSNAMAVCELGKLLKLNENKTLAAIGSYRGAWRRMEYRGNFTGGIPVYDDYAHHPTEIKATLAAFREKFPGRPIVCVFQPHQAKRLQALFTEFTEAFAIAHVLLLIPSYKVAGRDESHSKFTAERLAAAITKKYPRKPIYYLASPGRIKKMITKIIPLVSLRGSHASVPVLVMMGAGDIVKYTDSLIK